MYSPYFWRIRATEMSWLMAFKWVPAETPFQKLTLILLKSYYSHTLMTYVQIRTSAAKKNP